MKRLLWLRWIWPTIIIFSSIATGLVTFVITDTAVRPFIVLWFLSVCPGMALVPFFRLEESVIEWTLGLALSFAVDAIVAGILLYTGRWSPTGTLGILMGVSLGGAIVQIVLDSPISLMKRNRVSIKRDYVADLERLQFSVCTCGYVDDRPGGRFCPRCGEPKGDQMPLSRIERRSDQPVIDTEVTTRLDELLSSCVGGVKLENTSVEAFVPTSIQPLIDAYLHALQPVRSHLYGIYIFGSIALGTFEELESDIDILVLTHREWTTPELAQLNALHTHLLQTYQLSKRLEVLYIPLRDLGKGDREIAPYPTIQFGKFSPAGYADLNDVTWWTIKNKGIRLLGPEPSTLPFEVAWQDVLGTMRDNLNGFWAILTKRPYLFLLDGWIVIAVATLCRMLTTIEEEEIVTKSAALKRWRDRLPARWCPLIDEAWRIRHHLRTPSLYRSRLKRMREVLAFIQYVRERGGKAVEASLFLII